jgi:hypothetical protein
MTPDVARRAAVQAYKLSLDLGGSRDAALGVALAKLRAFSPTASEWELRSILAKALAMERQGAQTDQFS